MTVAWQELKTNNKIPVDTSPSKHPCCGVLANYEFATVIENDRDQVILAFSPIVGIFPDSLGAKSVFIVTFW